MEKTIICDAGRSSVRNGIANIYEVNERAHKEGRLTDDEFQVIKTNSLRIIECCGLAQTIEELKKAIQELKSESVV